MSVNHTYWGRLLVATVPGFIMSCGGWLGHFALSAKGHSWKEGIFWALRMHLLLPAHLHISTVFLDAPFTGSRDRQKPCALFGTMPVGKSGQSLFISYPGKISNHENNSAFCQHSIWLLASRRLFYSFNGWHIFLESALDDILVRELLKIRIQERNTFHFLLELFNACYIQPRKI